MRKLLLLVALGACMLVPTGCKTTEANYRQAYEKAVAGREDALELDSTIYGRVRRDMRNESVVSKDGRSLIVKTQLVKVTPDGGGIPENLREYNVVVGQFKQLFNARSMRNRLVDAGYPEAFVVQTAEPYYYVVLASRADVSEAFEAVDQFRKRDAVPVKAPCPFVLKATMRR